MPETSVGIAETTFSTSGPGLVDIDMSKFSGMTPEQQQAWTRLRQQRNQTGDAASNSDPTEPKRGRGLRLPKLRNPFSRSTSENPSSVDTSRSRTETSPEIKRFREINAARDRLVDTVDKHWGDREFFSGMNDEELEGLMLQIEAAHLSAGDPLIYDIADQLDDSQLDRLNSMRRQRVIDYARGKLPLGSSESDR